MDIENKYGVLDAQKYCLSMLKAFDSYCRNNDIKYSLDGGTLLGAVRHKGFIPWDDDIDIVFTRSNYDKFINCFNELPMEGYVIIGDLWINKLTLKTNPFIHVEGQCIDFFILDAVPKNAMINDFKILVLKILQGMMKSNIQYKRYPLLYRVLLFFTYILGLFFSKTIKKSLYDKVSKWGGFSDNTCISVYNTFFKYLGRKHSKEIVSDYLLLEFEKREFYCLSGFDEYLTNLYGDYMTPPEEKDRRPKHMYSLI